jgi:hypothetical protein
VESHDRAGRKSDSGEGRTEIINHKRDKKDLTAEHAEIAELVLGKDKRHKSLYGYGLLFAFPSSGDEDKRMNEEEAGSAKIASWNRLGPFRPSAKGCKWGRCSPCMLGLELFAIFSSAFSAISAVNFFIGICASSAKR